MAKRADIIKRINKAAKAAGAEWSFSKEGGKHSLYRLNELLIPVPRHNEIADGTTEAIYKQCESVLGKGWWRK